MNCTRPRESAPAVSWIIAALLVCLAAQASTQSNSSVAQGLGLSYDQASEVTLTGTVERLASSEVAGAPPGAHLFISTSGETVDTHLGPYLSKDVEAALKQGEPVQVVGVRQSAGGKNIFLVRQLTIAGRQVAIRNERGFLLRERVIRHTREHKPAVKGGAQ